MVFIDDATIMPMQRFVPSESTSRYLKALRGYLEIDGCLSRPIGQAHRVPRKHADAVGG